MSTRGNTTIGTSLVIFHPDQHNFVPNAGSTSNYWVIGVIISSGKHLPQRGTSFNDHVADNLIIGTFLDHAPSQPLLLHPLRKECLHQGYWCPLVKGRNAVRSRFPTTQPLNVQNRGPHRPTRSANYRLLSPGCKALVQSGRILTGARCK